MQHCETIFMPLIQTPLDNTREKRTECGFTPPFHAWLLSVAWAV